MNPSEKSNLICIAECSKDQDISNDALNQLRQINSTYHFCLEWDGMVICDEDYEYEFCSCLKE